MTAVIEAFSLSKTYGHKQALVDFTLKVPKGVIFGLLGPNGAGKTTAIEIMLGLRKSDTGSVEVLGENPQKVYGKIAPRIGAMLQQGGINPGLKPREAIKLYSSLYPHSLDIDELLKLVELDGVNTMVRRLSGGQAQSLSLALAIVGKPELIFLDEPTVGMDPRARRRTWEVIKDLRERGATVVLTTHLMDEAEMLCDEIAIVSKGSVIAQGDTGSLTQTKKELVEIEFLETIPAADFGHETNTSCAQIAPKVIQASTKPTPKFLFDLAQYSLNNNLTVISYCSKSKNLEDVFIELTEESESDPH